MKLLTASIAIVLVGGSFVVLNHRRSSPARPSHASDAPIVGRIYDQHGTVRAAGQIEGRTASVELRARLDERIESILVGRGQWVRAGEPLLQQQSELLVAERDLAAAMLRAAEAQKLKLQNGARTIEIDTAEHELNAVVARLSGARKYLRRLTELTQNDAASQQSFDEALAQVEALESMAAAAEGRLNTLRSPPRQDDLLAAEAEIQAAQARLSQAELQLRRATLRAPIDGYVLAVNAEPGELTGPSAARPVFVMADTKQLRAVVEVDEFDALQIQLNQPCEITADAFDGTLARGRVIEIAPQMLPKRLFGQWAGERQDTYARRVWIALESNLDLPVGLPIDASILTGTEPHAAVE